MRTFTSILLLAALLGPGLSSAVAVEPDKLPLQVLYLAREHDDARTDAFAEFLSAKFQQCTTAKRSDFRPEMLKGVDVAILDWSQQERHSVDYPSPLGRLEEFKTPLVLLGSAGHLIAGPWYVIGGAG